MGQAGLEAALKREAFVDKGVVFVSVNYGFVPNVTVKEMVGDVAEAKGRRTPRCRDFGLQHRP